MRGLIMDYELGVPAILRRAETLYGHKEIVTRLPDRSFHRYTYRDFGRRARRLADALRKLGYTDSTRVATLCWNHYQHLEVYFGVPASGNVVHTLNLRLHPGDLSYIAGHAGDRMLIVDESLLPLYDGFKDSAPFEHIVVIGNATDGTMSYDDLIATGDPEFEPPEIDERDAAVMCYTSGTTGQPKGVLYSHRAIAIHTLASCMNGTLGLNERDTALPVVPMFHANAWGYPFSCTLVGAKQVFPGPFLDPESLLDTIVQEKVTMTAGVPTIWLGILGMLDNEPDRWDLSALGCMVVGGSAAPKSLIEGFEKRHGIKVLHAWGMTEMCPLGTISDLTSDLREQPEEIQFEYRARQGTPAPFVEIRARGESGELVPWDGKTMGELEVRGVWIASSYYDDESQADRWTDDGWFQTGDIVTIDHRGYIEIQDRSKDVIKSGGEWISSVLLENAIMGHPAVAEAAVIAVPDEKWQERPFAVVVLRAGASATPEELREHLAGDFAKWQLPERFEFVDEIPKTAVGKFRKTALRELYAKEPAATS